MKIEFYNNRDEKSGEMCLDGDISYHKDEIASLVTAKKIIIRRTNEEIHLDGEYEVSIKIGKKPKNSEFDVEPLWFFGDGYASRSL